MPVDNHEKIMAFFPEIDDGDTFFYTELLDRSKRAGSNRMRMLKTFFHRSQSEFLLQWDTIRGLCDATNCRAYTRLSPRSYKMVGKVFAERILALALNEQWQDMRFAYASACGTVTSARKLWLLDVDAPSLSPFQSLERELLQRDVLVTILRSRTGFHIIVKPHCVDYDLMGITLSRDALTNLYIPDGAA